MLVASLRVLWLALLFLIAGLAGCFGGDDDPEVGDGEDENDEDKGRIEGEVVAEDNLDPIRSATVNLVEGGELVSNVTTEADGSFVMRNVEPGTYRIQVSATCCREGIASVTVEAGETHTVNFRLQRHGEVIIRTPFLDRDGEWEGLISCAAAATGQNPMFPGPCQTDPNHSHRHIEVFGAGVKTITFFMEWDPAGVAGGDNLRFTASNLNAGLHTFGEVEGSSPLELQVHNSEIEEDGNRFDAFEAGWVARLQVEPVSDLVDVVYQQPFTVYYHVHYWEEGDPGYSAAPS